MEKLGHGIYTPMDINLLPPLYLIYADNPSDSGKVDILMDFIVHLHLYNFPSLLFLFMVQQLVCTCMNCFLQKHKTNAYYISENTGEANDILLFSSPL